MRTPKSTAGAALEALEQAYAYYTDMPKHPSAKPVPQGSYFAYLPEVA
jgi:hypothetical protein